MVFNILVLSRAYVAWSYLCVCGLNNHAVETLMSLIKSKFKHGHIAWSSKPCWGVENKCCSNVLVKENGHVHKGYQ